ncbi:hypothetical protein [Marinomonas primoryensis]|jgi:hypothetical protein|uniref:Uncharacterized protein n=1 Tax=Marinomonas primoryensis TaxID=178399 RepID=A0A859CX96_9GAMM|nr:hypothetical protein [Marinomonas primoryensis]QKK81218.1 uncharacterized protein MP3633_2491 [Marinomonas primoryensis]|tara:strand:+ start:5296 stop:5601 length:306 start_codon:yes stop_codon:yes gene_type:complete
MTILIVINKPMFIGVTPHVRLASSQQRLNAKKVQLIPVTVEKANFKDVHQGQIYDVVQRDEDYYGRWDSKSKMGGPPIEREISRMRLKTALELVKQKKNTC